MNKSKLFRYLLIFILVVFALLTLFLSSSIIFNWFDMRLKQGNYVWFVVWANFISSILYLFAAYGFIKLSPWTFKVLGISLAILIIAMLGFLIYINFGGFYETKTIGAMLFRIIVTLSFTIYSYKKFKMKRK